MGGVELGGGGIYSPSWASLRNAAGVAMVRMVEPPSEEGVRLVISSGEERVFVRNEGFSVGVGEGWAEDWIGGLTAEFLDDAGEHPLAESLRQGG